MALAGQKKVQTQIESDFDTMRKYLQRAQDHANRQVSLPQAGLKLISLTAKSWSHSLPVEVSVSLNCSIHTEGSMDIKYLSKRFERGKQWVDSFFQTHHRYVATGLSDCHTLLAKFQSSEEGQHNTNPLHGCKSGLLVDESADASKSVSNANNNAALFVLMPQSNEWGRAVWSLQKKHLESGKLQGLDWRYIAFHDPQDDEAHLTSDAHCKYMEGVAKSTKDKSIPFLLEKDTDLLVQVSGQSKKLSCLAELACQAAQSSGLTEMSLEDHTVTQVVKDRLIFTH
eukprot:s2370_g6.t1